MRFEYHCEPDWPPLAWLARCHSNLVMIHHGSGVECRPEFFCEAIWNGPFEHGDLDLTDIVSGSGGRLRGREITFVSSGSTLDRLNVFLYGNETRISNSLPCLLSTSGANVDPAYNGYYKDFYSIVSGLDRYRQILHTSKGDITLVYFDNLHWNGHHLAKISKPVPKRSFASFYAYEQFLRDSMRAITANLVDGARCKPFRMLGTLSSGYDSTTVCTLAAEYGCEEVITFDRTHLGQNDSGGSVAGCLQLLCHRIDNEGWRRLSFPEIPFIAANSMGEEVRFRAAEKLLEGRVLFTGYHGDKVWGRDTKDLSSRIARGDPSGSSLTEYRLWAGFIHCAVPFWGVRQIAEINAISRSPEMVPWDYGGDYSRPICRRIVESAGVPRELFGVAKRNASVMLHNYEVMLTPQSNEEFFNWLRKNRGQWIRRGRFPPVVGIGVDRLMYRASNVFGDAVRKTPVLWRLARLVDGKPTYLRRYLFPWALDRAQRMYGKIIL